MASSAAHAWQPNYARRAEAMKASEIRELLTVLERPGVISFAGGIPDPELFPSELAARAYHSILTDGSTAGRAMQYSVSEGYEPLRCWIAQHMSQAGVAATPDNIIITSGSQQALDFLGKLLLSPADTALVTAPTYLGALQAFSAYEPRYDTINPGLGNRTPASYVSSAAAAGADAKVKFVYAVPDFANPTGITLDRKARDQLLALAYEIDIPVLEDSAYRSLRFEGEQLPSLQALDVARTGSLNASRVVYLGTFSKTVAPGLRIGWVCASEELIRRLVLVKQASDLNSSVANQMVMHQLVETGYEPRISVARKHYRAKRDVMLRALADHMPAGVQWTKPEGGLFVWVTLPDGLDGAALLERALAEANVAFVPGGAFFHDKTGKNTLRLSYSLPSFTQIEEGIERLAVLIQS